GCCDARGGIRVARGGVSAQLRRKRDGAEALLPEDSGFGSKDRGRVSGGGEQRDGGRGEERRGDRSAAPGSREDGGQRNRRTCGWGDYGDVPGRSGRCEAAGGGAGGVGQGAALGGADGGTEEAGSRIEGKMV